MHNAGIVHNTHRLVPHGVRNKSSTKVKTILCARSSDELFACVIIQQLRSHVTCSTAPSLAGDDYPVPGGRQYRSLVQLMCGAFVRTPSECSAMSEAAASSPHREALAARSALGA